MMIHSTTLRRGHLTLNDIPKHIKYKLNTKHLSIEFLSSNTHDRILMMAMTKVKKKVNNNNKYNTNEWLLLKNDETKMNRVSGVDELLTNNVEYIIDGI